MRFAYEIEYIMSFDAATFIVGQWTAMWSTFIYANYVPPWIGCKRKKKKTIRTNKTTHFHSNPFKSLSCTRSTHQTILMSDGFSPIDWNSILISHFRLKKWYSNLNLIFHCLEEWLWVERVDPWICWICLLILHNWLVWFFTVAVKCFASVTKCSGCYAISNCTYRFIK